jgi:hypothetical protein
MGKGNQLTGILDFQKLGARPKSGLPSNLIILITSLAIRTPVQRILRQAQDDNRSSGLHKS